MRRVIATAPGAGKLRIGKAAPRLVARVVADIFGDIFDTLAAQAKKKRPGTDVEYTPRVQPSQVHSAVLTHPLLTKNMVGSELGGFESAIARTSADLRRMVEQQQRERARVKSEKDAAKADTKKKSGEEEEEEKKKTKKVKAVNKKDAAKKKKKEDEVTKPTKAKKAEPAVAPKKKNKK